MFIREAISWVAAHLRSEDEDGASLVEYALLLALIAVVCIAAVSFMGESTSASFSRSTNSMFVSN